MYNRWVEVMKMEGKGVRKQEDEERLRMQDSKVNDAKGLGRVHDAG